MADSHREEIAKLEALYAGNPGGRVFVHLAEAYRKAGEHERARRILDEGLGRHPDSASGYVVLGRVLADMQVSAEAEIAFRRVLELDGGNLVALRWLGDIARQAGRNGEAAMHYRELLIRNPSNEEVRDLVEIVEREAADAPAEPTAEGAEGGMDAFARLDEIEAEGDTAVSEPISEAEEPAVTAAPAAGGEDVANWSAAPGETGDAEETPVEFGLVELESIAEEQQDEEPESAGGLSLEAAGDHDDAPAQEPVWGVPSAGFRPSEPGAGDVTSDALQTPGEFHSEDEVRHTEESDLVASTDGDDADLLELDELRRDDEAEPVEIHLLDPSYEPSEEDGQDEYAGELDLSDLQSSSMLDDADDYADESFVADLSAAGAEETAPDELPLAADVMDAALTLLPDDGAETDEAARGAQPDAFEPEPDAAAQDDEIDVEIYAGNAFAAESPQDVAGADAAAGDTPESDDAVATDYARLSGAAAPAAESHPAAPAREPESGLVTETMAVLYRSQGFHDRAADVYRALLRNRPGDERLSAKLREAEEAARSTGRSATSGGADDEAGEVWLRGVGAAWTGHEQSAREDDATPYAWAPESDEAEAGEPIATYLQDLVSWKAGSNAWVQPDTRSTEDAAGEIEMPDWLNGPGNSEPWTPESDPVEVQPAAAEDTGWEQPPAAEDPVWTSPSTDEAADPWESPASGAGPEPVAETGPASGNGTAAAEAGGDSAEDSAGGDADGSGLESAPWEQSSPATSDAAEMEGGGWTPFELDADLPAAAAAPEPAAPPSGLQDLESDDDESSDDDDLEMFRAWLQSLKK